MKKAVWFAVCSALLMGVGSVASADHHESGEMAWDQAKVTELATTLVKQVDDVRKAQRGAPTAQIASGFARSQMRFTDDLRLIENESKHLSRQLADGKTKDETQAVYDRLQSLVASAGEDARRMMMVEQVTSKIDVARATLNQLRGFYGDPPVPTPAR